MTWASQAYNPGSNPGDRITILIVNSCRNANVEYLFYLYPGWADTKSAEVLISIEKILIIYVSRALCVCSVYVDIVYLLTIVVCNFSYAAILT
jgi:hypothetical protein